MQTWHHVLRKSHSASMKSNTCEDEARFTVQVGPQTHARFPRNRMRANYRGRIQVPKETPSRHIGKDGSMAGDCIRLTAVERVKIELGLRDGLSLTAIAAELGRPKGTMSKEI